MGWHKKEWRCRKKQPKERSEGGLSSESEKKKDVRRGVQV